MEGDSFNSYTIPDGITVSSTEQGGCSSSSDQVISATATGEAIQQYGMVDPSNLSNSDFLAIVNASLYNTFSLFLFLIVCHNGGYDEKTGLPHS